MGENLIIRYDRIGGFLFIELCHPYAEQDSDMIDDAVVARFNLTTGEMESVEVLFFDSWLEKEGAIRIPVGVTLWPTGAALPKGVSPSSAEATMTIKYAQSGDTLTLALRPPHSGQYRREICEGVSAGLNSETGLIEHLEIRSFKARMEQDGKIVLPIDASLRPAEPANIPD